MLKHMGRGQRSGVRSQFSPLPCGFCVWNSGSMHARQALLSYLAMHGQASLEL